MRGQYCEDTDAGFAVEIVIWVNPVYPSQDSRNEPESNPWIPYFTLPPVPAWVGRR